MPKLYLIPTSLGDCDFDRILPPYNAEVVKPLRHFIVEDIRSARRFLKRTDAAINIDELTFYELNKHTNPDEIAGFLKPLSEGYDVGVLSEAGCPAVADPGADVVAIAQQKGYTVVPLVGPSSILLALMGSGFNGQSFAFVGYLPVQPADRVKTLKKLESRVYSESQTQIFIETPYRNMKMLEDILTTCQPNTRLCIAVDITLETEFIKTKTVKEWKKQLPDLNKRPCIFLIYK
ncbi:SAM-dependent methyltransferase [Paludibacter sp. 221]|uniref:SAM-dependent methyltransferase n=1 Tax=Paludibacter sp. 221 TaxID=2302939 RepID=UPI0013D47640|nr:SAM-dependent methyltransferase [Paludibacter sp. 221]NDV46152.1 SAM-dependent methyltransferase [Paludibacter sp. 221]